MQILQSPITTLGSDWFVFKNLNETDAAEILHFCYNDERTVWLMIKGPAEMQMPTFDLRVQEFYGDHAKFCGSDGHTMSVRFGSISDICVLRKAKDELIDDLRHKVKGD